MTTSHPVPPVRAGSSTRRDAVVVAVFVAVVAVLGLVPAVPLSSGVPLTAQGVGVVLAGAVLGARRGFLCLLVLVALVALGLPLLTGGRGGLGVLDGPTGGFVVGLPVAALVTGLLTQRFTGAGPHHWGAGLAATSTGVLVLGVFGALGATWATGEWSSALLVLLPGGLLQAVLAASVAHRVHAVHPGLLPASPRR